MENRRDHVSNLPGKASKAGPATPSQPPRSESLEWVRPPLQARSQQTLERLLDAAEALIMEKGVDAASISAVARRAGSSVGAFYARFPDKDALLRSVFERFAAQARATIDAVSTPERWTGVSVGQLLREVLGFALREVSDRQAVLAGLMACSARDATLSASVDGIVRHLGERIYFLLVARGDLAASPVTELRAGVLGGVMLSVLQARSMHHPDHQGVLPDALLADELTELSLRYLAVAGAERGQNPHEVS